MYVADNYGSKWVKGIINWFRNKTLEGIQYDNLIVEATLECGLRRGKLIELVNEYVETGLLVMRDRKIYWVDITLKPLEVVMNKEEKPDIKDRKPKMVKDYDEYVKECIKLKLEKPPLEFAEWLKGGKPKQPIIVEDEEKNIIEDEKE